MVTNATGLRAKGPRTSEWRMLVQELVKIGFRTARFPVDDEREPTTGDAFLTAPARNTRSGCAPSAPCAELKSRSCDTGHRARNSPACRKVGTGCEDHPEFAQKHRPPVAVGMVQRP